MHYFHNLKEQKSIRNPFTMFSDANLGPPQKKKINTAYQLKRWKE